MTQEQLLEHLKQNPFVLAPMAGITDCGFRSFMREMKCGAVVTELVSAMGLKYSSKRTRKLMKFENVQHPVGIQIFGEELEALEYAAKESEQMGADFVDINFGCPVPKVVKKGAGSAALKDLDFLREVIHATKKSVSIPVTIKVRTGWDQNSRNTHEVVKIAYNEGVTWVAIHGRTRAQAYAGKSDWDYIKEVKQKSPLPILGNGDITSAEKAISRLIESGCEGVLIGRGALKNPWIFQEVLALKSGLSVESVSKDFDLMFSLLWSCLARNHEPRMIGLQIKKLAAWYSAGYPGSALFRKTIFSLQDPEEAFKMSKEYFVKMSQTIQKDTSEEPFLMGGHG